MSRTESVNELSKIFAAMKARKGTAAALPKVTPDWEVNIADDVDLLVLRTNLIRALS